MCQAEQGRRNELEHAEPPIHREGRGTVPPAKRPSVPATWPISARSRVTARSRRQWPTSRPRLPRPARLSRRRLPPRPPTSAWLLLDGRPSHHVSTFQVMAPARAPKMTSGSTTLVSTTPLPIVAATWSPKTANAMKLKKAAHSTAVKRPQHPRRHHGCNGVGTIVQPVEEIEQQGNPDQTDQYGEADHHTRHALDLLDDDAVDHVDHVLATVNHRFDQVIDLLDRQLRSGRFVAGEQGCAAHGPATRRLRPRSAAL